MQVKDFYFYNAINRHKTLAHVTISHHFATRTVHSYHLLYSLIADIAAVYRMFQACLQAVSEKSGPG